MLKLVRGLLFELQTKAFEFLERKWSYITTKFDHSESIFNFYKGYATITIFLLKILHLM